MNREVSRLFEAASGLPAGERAAFLSGPTVDPEVRREVLSLLAHDALAEPFFADAFESAASSLHAEPDFAPGSRIGAFMIVRMLGQGGMGVVYLATRSDGSFEQTVAIKVIRVAEPAAQVLERFQQERQILARLSHSNIARLLDGGETPAGLPYFVMEHVPGQDIDRYCNKAGLNLRQRMHLFLRVASAVQHAHEHLVIHRDLKPGNILVGDDGEPKLLDFGIAKVVDPRSGPTAAVSTRLLTPEYASPEQVRGGAITTATDIYCLGGVLYRLLTGALPHAIADLSPLDAVLRIVEQEVPRASNLPFDVAAILEKALHTDPARRYRSADELSKDLERYLDGEPVLAVRDSMGYRAAKFLRKRWIPVSAFAAVILALTVGAAVAISQARRAEHRFAEVRQLSNKFLFEFEEAIHNIAGATKARELLVKTAQEYLDRLAADARGGIFQNKDPELIRELAYAYQKLGDIQGSPIDGNTGNTKGGLESYRKAVSLLDSAAEERVRDTKARVAFLMGLVGLANAELVSGDESRALPLCERAVALGESWIQGGSSDGDLLFAVSNAHFQLSDKQRGSGLFDAGVTNAKQGLSLRQQAWGLRQGDPRFMRGVAIGYWAVGSAEKIGGHSEEAVAAFTAAVEWLRRVAAMSPENSQNRRELLTASWLLAGSTSDLLFKQKKGLEPLVPLWQEASRIGTQLLRDDPANAMVEADVALISLGLGTTLQQVGRPQEGLRALTAAVARQEERYKSDPGNRTAAYYLAMLYVGFADCYKDLHNVSLALRNDRSAMTIFDSLVKASPTRYDYQYQQARNFLTTGNHLAEAGDFAGARAMYRESLKVAERLPKGPALHDPALFISEIRDADRLVAAKMGAAVESK